MLAVFTLGVLTTADVIGIIALVIAGFGGVGWIVSRFDRAFDRLREENSEQHAENKAELVAMRGDSNTWRSRHDDLHLGISEALGEIRGRLDRDD